MERTTRQGIIGQLVMLVVGLVAAASAQATDRPDLRRPYRSWCDVVFAEAGGEKLRADIYSPELAAENQEKLPAVLMIHGGAWSAGDKWNMRDHARQLAQAGYVAISINYRLAPIHKYPAQLDDCKSAYRWLLSVADQYQIDTSRLAVYGYSAGGHLAGLLATNPEPDLPRFKVAVLGGAPCDLTFIPEKNKAIAHVFGGTRGQLPLVYQDASPVNYCTGDDCPIFFYHGETDLIVPPESSRVMYEKLAEQGVEVKYFSVEKQGHLITFIDSQARLAAIEFLNRHLKQER